MSRSGPVYPEWGWGTDDGAQALGYLKRFGSVSILNGHIHQVVQKVEGNMTFHTAASTAFPTAQARFGAFTGTDEGSGGAASVLAGSDESKLCAGPGGHWR